LALLLCLFHDDAADQRDPRADPTGAIPPAEIDLPGGSVRAAEAGGLGFEPRLVIPCKIGYNAWIYYLCPLGLLYRSTWLGRQVAFLEIRKVIPGL